MPWWVWLLLAWTAVAALCALWWGLALANADAQDAARQITEDADVDHGSPAS